MCQSAVYAPAYLRLQSFEGEGEACLQSSIDRRHMQTDSGVHTHAGKDLTLA